MKHIIIIVTIILVSTNIIFAQRNEYTGKNTYQKIYEETHPGKRTARCLNYLLVPEYFKESFTASPCNDFIDKANNNMESFNKFIDFFATCEKDDKQMQAATKKFAAEMFKKEYENIDYFITYAQKQGAYTGDKVAPLENLVCRVKGTLQGIKAIKAYAQGVKKIFPITVAKVDELIAYADKAIATFPDNKAIIAHIKKNLSDN